MKIGNFNFEKDATHIIDEPCANHGGEISIAKDTINAVKSKQQHTKFFETLVLT